MENLITPILEAEILNEIIQEEKNALKKETHPELEKRRAKRIKEAQQLNKIYLTILN